MRKLLWALSIDHCPLTIYCLQCSLREYQLTSHGKKPPCSRESTLKMDLNFRSLIYSYTVTFTISQTLLITVHCKAIH